MSGSSDKSLTRKYSFQSDLFDTAVTLRYSHAAKFSQIAQQALKDSKEL